MKPNNPVFDNIRNTDTNKEFISFSSLSAKSASVFNHSIKNNSVFGGLKRQFENSTNKNKRQRHVFKERRSNALAEEQIKRLVGENGPREHKAARTLQKAFRRVISESNIAYDHMLTNGVVWKNYAARNSITLDRKTFIEHCKANMASLYTEVVGVIEGAPILEPREFAFLEKVKEQKLYAVHVTEEAATKNIEREHSIGLFSRQALQKQKIPFDESHTQEEDLEDMAADGFIYFSLGLTETVRKPSSRFGNTAYNIKIEEVKKFESGFFSLHDPAYPQLGEPQNHIGDLSDDAADTLLERQHGIVDEHGIGKTYDFVYPIGEKGADIKEVLALAIIRDTRLLENEEDKKIILEGKEHGEEFTERLEKIITAFYRPQLIVPRHLYVTRNGKGDGKKVGEPQKIKKDTSLS